MLGTALMSLEEFWKSTGQLGMKRAWLTRAAYTSTGIFFDRAGRWRRAILAGLHGECNSFHLLRINYLDRLLTHFSGRTPT